MLWRRFVETHATIVRRLDEDLRAQSGLTLSSFEVLYELVRAPGNRLRMAELADRLLFTRSGVTRLVDRLVRDGYVERNECVHDGRGVYAILTEKGFETFESGRCPAHRRHPPPLHRPARRLGRRPAPPARPARARDGLRRASA